MEFSKTSATLPVTVQEPQSPRMAEGIESSSHWGSSCSPRARRHIAKSAIDADAVESRTVLADRGHGATRGTTFLSKLSQTEEGSPQAHGRGPGCAYWRGSRGNSPAH